MSRRRTITIRFYSLPLPPVIMPSLSVVSLLMMGYVTSTSGYDVPLCPGQSFLFPKPSLIYGNLFFETNVTGSSKKLVANSTHIFLPSYQFKDGTVFIPEVMKRHVGEYRWTSNLFKVSSIVIKLFFKDCSVERELYYGDEFTLTVPKEASVLEFTTPKSPDHWVLWSRINNDNKRGARGLVIDDCWEALNITHADAGHYTFLKESGDEISSTRLFVKEIKRRHDISDKAIKRSRIPVPISEAVLMFRDSKKAKHVLFDNGVVTDEAFKMFGSRINMQVEFGELTLTIMDLMSNDTGIYNVHDKNEGLAIAMYVYGNKGSSSSHSERIQLWAPIGVTGSLLLLCGHFVRQCCNSCKKRDALQQSDCVHVTSREEYYTPSAEETERQLWQQGQQPQGHRRASDPPPYDEVVGTNFEPCPPYSPAAPM